MVNATSGLFRYTSVTLAEVQMAGGRLDASVFNIEARQAREVISGCPWRKVPLAGVGGLTEAYHRPRFKRPYVDKPGIPFYQPSQLNDLSPTPARFLSGFKPNEFDPLRVKKNQILLTCSGTVGEVSMVGNTLDGAVFSHDLIRMNASKEVGAGYIYTFLRSSIGHCLLTTSNYGAVIQHIEPEHLYEIQVPVPSEELVDRISDMILQSFKYRDESNSLISEAQSKLIKAINLPELSNIKLSLYKTEAGVLNWTVSPRNLDERLDGSYFNPLANAIESLLVKSSHSISSLGDKKLVNEIILPGRFKRIYVEDGFGVPFLGGKELGTLDPRTGKNLSLQGHGPRIKDQLTIHQNQVMITCSGTIGKVAIAPRHWEGWTSSQHVIRLQPSSSVIGGYLYAWLSTDYAKELIKRFTYGAVVDEVDATHIGGVLVPLVDEPLMAQIGELVLAANDKRAEAFELEQAALNIFNKEVLGLSFN
ncbi:restriction endonuclease subunit S [Polynucleobacter sp. P1-05-14]|nr:restriction endonuclease subunit S [Polynucleobacter sp. P1-05-14]